MSDVTLARRTAALPQLLLSADDYDHLLALARMTAGSHAAENAQRLLDELYRANIVPSRWVPNDTVTMNAYVEYRNEDTGAVRCVQLVFPHDADPGKGRISVLSSVGTALIGLAVGQSITWSGTVGPRRRLTVLRVSDKPFDRDTDDAA